MLMYQKLCGSSVASSYISCKTFTGYRAERSSMRLWISFAFRSRQTHMKRKFTRATVAVAVSFWLLSQQEDPR